MKPYKLDKNELNKVRYPVFIQPKFDGWRVIILNGKALTYALKPIPNHWIRTELERIFGGLGYFLIDGEGLLMDEKATYQDIQSAYATREGKPDFRFVMFDAFKVEQQRAWYYSNRMMELDTIKHKLGFQQLANRSKDNKIHSIQYYQKINTGVGLDFALNYWVEQGYEGAIIRDYNGTYRFGRSTLNSQELMAYKPYTDAEARITGCYRLRKNKNEPELDKHGHTKRGHSKAGKVEVNLLGGFSVIGINGRFEGKSFEVGSGFTLAQRRKFFLEWESNIDKIIKYKYLDVGSLDKPRHPIFLGFRTQEDME